MSIKSEQLVNNLLEDRDKRFVKCREGWVVYEPSAGGRYRVTATGQRAVTVDRADLNYVVQDLCRRLGGRVLVREADEGQEPPSAKKFILSDPEEPDLRAKASQIAGDFGDPWVYGGTWKHPDTGLLWHTSGLEGEGIKDVEPWDVKVPPEVERQIVQRFVPGDFTTLEQVKAVPDPDIPEDELYEKEIGDIEQAIDDWQTDEAEKRNREVALPVYHFDDELPDWVDWDEIRDTMGFSEEDWDEMPDAGKFIEAVHHLGPQEFDSYPENYTKEELVKYLKPENISLD